MDKIDEEELKQAEAMLSFLEMTRVFALGNKEMGANPLLPPWMSSLCGDYMGCSQEEFETWVENLPDSEEESSGTVHEFAKVFSEGCTDPETGKMAEAPSFIYVDDDGKAYEVIPKDMNNWPGEPDIHKPIRP